VEAVVVATRTEGTSLAVMMTPLHHTRTIVRRGMNQPKAGGQVSGVVLRWVALRLTYLTVTHRSRRHRLHSPIELHLMIGNAKGLSRFLSSLVHCGERHHPSLRGMMMTEGKAPRILAP